jgi:ectoine hydroxylase-related dioxygenase (phytanoyl-CoA dioxygenase family)
MTTTVARWAPMSEQQAAQFDRDGYLIIRGALTPDEVRHYAAALDDTYARAQAAGTLAADGSLHLLSAVASNPELVGLIDHPTVFPLVWSTLGWNVHIYHSHLDVHPPVRGPRPFWWHWHQDGGRQNRELETAPRPRMSVKLAFWLSDVSQTGRGNLTVVPGSHRTDWLSGPPRRDVQWPAPPGAVEVTVQPGDVTFFDRRIWHARSTNRSEITRKCVFIGYTYRWITIRDEVAELPGRDWWGGLGGIRRQLLGGVGRGDGDHAWGHYPQDTPLYTELARRGLLADGYPPLKP